MHLPLPVAPMLPLALLALSGCEFEREGTQALPQSFLGAETKLQAEDIVEITVTVARPRPGALQAYSDCVGAQYTLIRGMTYARRITTFPDISGLADVLREKTTYLLANDPPSDTALTAAQIVATCKANQIPTV